MQKFLIGVVVCVLGTLWVQPVPPASAETLTYQTPPKALADLVNAPLTPSVSVSPDRTRMLVMERPALPSIAEMAEPELRIGGVRLKPRTNGPSRGWTLTRLIVRDIASGEETPITGVPEGLRLDDATWSPDGKWVAFTTTSDNDIHLWVADTGNGKAKRILDRRLNAALANAFVWLSDSRTLIATTVPKDRGAPPEAPLVPTGPIVQENMGGKSPARTYQDLLKNPHDEALFTYYLTSQLVRVSVEGKSTEIGPAGIISDLEPAPNGEYLLVETMHTPFSYLVPYYRFPKRVEIWNLKGDAIHQIADLPRMESVPIAYGSVPTGPREYTWRPDQPATIYWAEAQDGGDAGAEAEIRDAVFMLAAPFDAPPTQLVQLAQRYWTISWAENGTAFAWEWWWKTRNVKTWMLDTESADAEPVLLWDRSYQDRYSDPGNFVTRRNDWGESVIIVNDANRAFLIGEGASDEGDRPFLDTMDLTTRETTRLWRSEAPYYEMPLTLADAQGERMISRRESVKDQPNYFLHDVTTDELTQITHFPHPHEELSGIKKELIEYERADGVKLSGTLYLPPGYDAERDGLLPVVMWAYPTEYKSADAAGQIEDSPYRFDRVAWYSPLAWLTQGYAVLDDPKLPIIGEGEDEPNDTYVDQLVAGAEAAVNELVRRGVGDPKRMAIAGHSYGAFMAANLLTHSDLFAAGIARSGAYNRTLTPFGFQSEERTVWEAPEVYFAMSPFMHADAMNQPLLLIHGEEDNNSGTYPMQSERYFNALKGLGATTRLVMLPEESHGYRGRESVMHVMWETNQWLSKYVRDPEPKDAPSPSSR